MADPYENENLVVIASMIELVAVGEGAEFEPKVRAILSGVANNPNTPRSVIVELGRKLVELRADEIRLEEHT